VTPIDGEEEAQLLIMTFIICYQNIENTSRQELVSGSRKKERPVGHPTSL
jgi:hypothetical protein